MVSSLILFYGLRPEKSDTAKPYYTQIYESESHSVVSDSLWPHGLYSPWNSPGETTGVGSLSLLQGIFPAQGLNPGLWHCRWILYLLSHKESPRILEWIAYPICRGSSQPRNRTGFLLHCRLYTQIQSRRNPGHKKLTTTPIKKECSTFIIH